MTIAYGPALMRHNVCAIHSQAAMRNGDGLPFEEYGLVYCRRCFSDAIEVAQFRATHVGPAQAHQRHLAAGQATSRFCGICRRTQA